MEPAKPFEKKSELTKKLSLQPGGAGGTLTKLPPINTAAATSKAPEKGVGGLNETKNGAAYQVNQKKIELNSFCCEPRYHIITRMPKMENFLFDFQLAALLSSGRSMQIRVLLTICLH